MTTAARRLTPKVGRCDYPSVTERRSIPVKKPGVAEIKPHSPSGIAKGLVQLRGPNANRTGQRWLVTYRIRAMPMSDRPGRASVLAFQVDDNNCKGPWHIGDVTLPVKIDFPPADNPGYVGWAMETIVAEKLRSRFPGHFRWRPNTGGARPGADAQWYELAHLYAELAGETSDPYFAALAGELARLAG